MTLLGMHTIAELKDLLAAKNYEIDQIQNAYEAFRDEWSKKDRIAQEAWDRDWSLLRARYLAARLKAQTSIGLAALKVGVPDSLIPAEDDYELLTRALREKEGEVRPGDLQDLYGRLSDARGSLIDVSKVPQPGKSSDADVNVVQGIDKAALAAKGAAKSSAPWVVGGVVAFAVGLVGYEMWRRG